jgi:hypothetical protein
MFNINLVGKGGIFKKSDIFPVNMLKSKKIGLNPMGG